MLNLGAMDDRTLTLGTMIDDTGQSLTVLVGLHPDKPPEIANGSVAVAIANEYGEKGIAGQLTHALETEG